MSESQPVPHSNMTNRDWQDIAESEFRDMTQSAMGTKIAFVFEHDEIGLHGFQFLTDTGELKPCAFDELDP